MSKLSPVEASDPKKDGFLSYEEVIEALCTFGVMRYEREGSNVCEVFRPVGRVRDDTLRRLMEDGWLKGYANGGGFWISDEGHKAYLRSTDELGDCKLRAPVQQLEGRAGDECPSPGTTRERQS